MIGSLSPIAPAARSLTVVTGIALVCAGAGAKEAPATDAELVVQTGHSEPIYAVAVSPDGHIVATGSEDDSIKLWDLQSGLEIRSLYGHEDLVDDVAFSPDGTELASASWDGTVRLWEVATGESGQVHQLEGWGRSVAYSPDGDHLVAGDQSGWLSLWEPGSRRSPERIPAHTDDVTAVAFSPDGRWLATGGEDGVVMLWNALTHREIWRSEARKRRIESLGFATIASLDFSPDGTELLSTDGTYVARTWDVATGAVVRSFPGRSSCVNCDSIAGAYLPDDDHLWIAGVEDDAGHSGGRRSSGQTYLKIWTRTGEVRRTVPLGYGSGVGGAAGTPDGRFVITATGTRAATHEVEVGETRRYLIGGALAVDTLRLSPSGRHLMSVVRDGTVHVWDLEGGLRTRVAECPDTTAQSIAMTSDEGLLAVGGRRATGMDRDIPADEVQESRVCLWAFPEYTPVGQLHPSGSTNGIDSLDFSPDDRLLAAGADNGYSTVFDLQSEEPMSGFDGHQDGARFLCGADRVLAVGPRYWQLDPGVVEWRLEEPPVPTVWGIEDLPVDANDLDLTDDCVLAITNGPDDSAIVWDVASRSPVRRLPHPELIQAVAISPNGERAATGGWGGDILLWHPRTGELLHRLEGHRNQVKAVTFSRDGRWLYSGSLDGTLRMWDTATGSCVAVLVSFVDGQWAVADEAGRYDGSGRGDVAGLHWVVGTEPIELSQLRERYFEPGLLKKLHRDIPLRDVGRLGDVTLYPDVHIRSSSEEGEFLIELEERGGGFGPLQVFVNDKELPGLLVPEASQGAATAELTVDIASSPALRAGESNDIRFVPWNADGFLAGRGARVAWTAPGQVQETAPHLWAVVAGVSDYEGDDIDLGYAAKDARDFATALEIGAARLFGPDRVHLELLADVDDPTAALPSSANLTAAFERLRGSNTGDVVVIYLAGHGVAMPERNSTYAYLTQEARSTDSSVLRDPAVLSTTAVTSERLAEWLNAVPALKQVLVLDTCAAGAVAPSLLASRDINGDQIRAIDRLRRRTGLHALMGSAADQASYEATRFGQGVLTYALLEGMRGAALQQDNEVDVSALFHYAVDRVPALAAHVGGIQRPRVMAPDAASFSIGLLAPEDRLRIPLAEVLPVLLQPRAFHSTEGFDALGLEPHLRAALRELRSARERGKAVYVDADDLPGGIRIVASYDEAGGQVDVTVTLVRDGDRVDRFDVSGSPDALGALASEIVARVVDALAPSP